MIITLSGKITQKGDGYAVIDVAGVGYQVFMGPSSLGRLRLDNDAHLWTHEHSREDARDLYGFLTQAEHRLFRRLIAVSGVGPKTGLNVLAVGPVKDIEAMIEKGDVERLCGVNGIGKKTAQKIVLELKGKLVDAKEEGGDADVVAALVGLGYAREKARDALMKVTAGDGVEERLRAALKELGRK